MTETPFASIPVFDRDDKKTKKVNYLKIVPGYPVRIRILTEAAHMVVKHFLPKQRISVVCLGDECPVCLNNKKLVEAHPGVLYNEIPGIIGRQTRFLINVLNRTPVKATEKAVYYAGSDGKFPRVSDEGLDLSGVEAKQLNTIEVLERGSTLFSQLNAIHDSFRDEEGNRLGLTNFDIVLTATGKGKSMVITALPAMQYSDKVEYDPEALYDLEKVPMTLGKDEIWKLLEGAQFQDVIESRKATAVNVAVPTKLAEEVEDTLAKFFEDED